MDLLTTEELIVLRRIPAADIVELATELEIPASSTVDQILSEAVLRLAQRARREGLPLSRYDEAFLRGLGPDGLEALAHLCGVRPSIDALLAQGERVYRDYERRKAPSQVVLLLPMLLGPLARHALATEGRAQSGHPRAN